MKIALLGDICLTDKFDLELNPDAFHQFDLIKSILDECDFVVGNLESPFTEKASSLVCKAIHIKSPPTNTRLLKYLGVDAVSLANNHIFDYGREGYLSTLAALDEVGIAYFGTENQALTLEKNGEKVMFGGFCCLSAHPSKANRRGVNTLKPASFKEFLDVAQADRAFPITSVHWGDENIHFPREDHVRFARQMATSHDFLLHGHHPHVVQGLEENGNSLFAYSLGNFCTGIHVSKSVRDLTVKQSVENLQSFLLVVDIDSGNISKHEIIPIEDKGREIVVGNGAALSKIEDYSAALTSSYNRPAAPPPENSEDSSMPARFSASWILKRLNYHFIGAYLKGVVNRIKYHRYFATVN